MALHLIPDDDGLPHAPTSECGCGVRAVTRDRDDGFVQVVYLHRAGAGDGVLHAPPTEPPPYWFESRDTTVSVEWLRELYRRDARDGM